jgi:hypothetical protein
VTTFSPNPAPGTSSTMNVTTSNSTPPGTYLCNSGGDVLHRWGVLGIDSEHPSAGADSRIRRVLPKDVTAGGGGCRA